MKQTLATLVLLLTLATAGQAQRVVYADTDYILGKLPAYTQAQAQLDELAALWQERIEQAYAGLEQMYKQYRAEEALYSQDMKKRKEDEIMAKERAIKDLQQKYFGPEGELFKKRQELIAPIQDELYEAIKAVAEKGNYGIVLDKASGTSILFAEDRYDISDDVLKMLGQ